MSTGGYVMVVDDDEALGESVCELLALDGYRTQYVSGAARALARLRDEAAKPSLILLDLMMPGMSGWQFREEQLRDPTLAPIPVVVMTATRELRGIAADGVVYKPLKMPKVTELVRRHATPEAVSNGGPAPVAARPASTPPVRFASTPHDWTRSLFTGGGEMGARMAEVDWSRTALGPVDGWPQSLKTCVRIILTSQQPMFVWWGDELTNIYNDAYKSIIGGKHPGALAQPASTVWREIWDQVGPRAEKALRANEGTYDESLLLIMERHGYQEETYYTFSYSPVLGDDGAVGGILCANTDDTQRIIGERQLVLLRDLASRTAEARTLCEVYDGTRNALASNDKDIPFALLYMAEGGPGPLRLEAAVGIARDSAAAPATLTMDGTSSWRLAEAAQNHGVRVIADLASRFGALPAGAWAQPPNRAVAVDIVASGDTGRPGLLIVGLNPFRLLDEGYRGFIDLVAGQIAASAARARAYEDERKRADALAAIDRAKTTFFSNVSHEFRTPLTLMLGPTQDLLAGLHGPLGDDQREQLAVIHRSELRLQKLVNALLEFSRLEAGRIQASYEPVDLATATRELASAFQSTIERAGLAFVIDCATVAEPVYVDRDMWEKIVLNLLSNALKFTFEGSISISLKQHPGHVVLAVTDTGVGIPAVELPRVFERFHRVEGTRARTHEGSGIGLALVQELAKLHGGSVTVDSAVSRGTTFSISIPTGSDHLPKERIVAPAAHPPGTLASAPFVEEALRWLPGPPGNATEVAVPPDAATSAHPSLARILVADDNGDMREYIRRHLERHWTVDTVEDGEKALARARMNPPDLVVTDVMMPRLDGFGLLRALRADDRTSAIPVIMLSARAGEEASIDGLRAGAEDYLVKPFSPAELLARVRTHLEIARMRSAITAERERLQALFMQAPVAIGVLTGPELRYELANPLYVEMIGGRAIVGKTVREAFPELPPEADVFTVLKDVYTTGRPFSAEEYRVPLDRKGTGALDDLYFRFVCNPVFGEGGRVHSLLLVAVDVTAQVASRRQLQASEEKFRNIVAQVEAGIAQTDLTGRFVLSNERFREMVGRSEAELTQSRMQDITHPDDLPRNLEGFTKLIELGTPFVIEKRYVKPDGSIVWVQNSVSRIDDRDGRPLGVAAVSIDITQRKYADVALRESEERFRNMADHAPVMIWMTDADGRCTYLSQSWYELTGQSPKQALGYGWLDAVHPDDRAHAHAVFRTANETHAPFRLDYRLRARDGNYRFTIDSASPRHDASGAFLGYIGSVIDITDRRLGELALGASEARFRSMFETAEVSMWDEDLTRVKGLVDGLLAEHGDGLRAFLDGQPTVVEQAVGLIEIRDVNPATLRMFGASEKREILSSFTSLVLPESRSVVVEQLMAIAEGKRMFTSEAAMQTLQGKRLDVALTMGLPQPDQPPDRVLVSLIDITARKQVEREREARVTEMERAVRFSDLFAGILGHDLRNPLSAITATANLLESRADNDRIAKPVHRIVLSAERMERMIAQLLDFTRIRLGGGLPLERTPVDLAELGRTIVDELAVAKQRPISIASVGVLVGHWDRDRLAQLLSNLCANASQHGTADVPVTMILDGTDATVVRIHIKNGGVIPADLLPVVFEPLRQTDTSRKSEGSSGLGLGLFITKQIALAHGGSIRVDSDEALGTRFVVELPRRQRPAGPPDAGVA